MPKNGNDGRRLLALRKSIGRIIGKPKASRAVVAKLLGVSEGSLSNWESGKTEISKRYGEKLAELERAAKDSSLALELARMGSTDKKSALWAQVTRRLRPGKALRVAAPRARAGILRADTAIFGTTDVAYANTVTVEHGARESRIRFGLALPGEKGAKVVADVLVRQGLLARLSR